MFSFDHRSPVVCVEHISGEWLLDTVSILLFLFLDSPPLLFTILFIFHPTFARQLAYTLHNAVLLLLFLYFVLCSFALYRGSPKDFLQEGHPRKDPELSKCVSYLSNYQINRRGL